MSWAPSPTNSNVGEDSIRHINVKHRQPTITNYPNYETETRPILRTDFAKREAFMLLRLQKTINFFKKFFKQVFCPAFLFVELFCIHISFVLSCLRMLSQNTKTASFVIIFHIFLSFCIALLDNYRGCMVEYPLPKNGGGNCYGKEITCIISRRFR